MLLRELACGVVEILALSVDATDRFVLDPLEASIDTAHDQSSSTLHPPPNLGGGINDKIMYLSEYLLGVPGALSRGWVVFRGGSGVSGGIREDGQRGSLGTIRSKCVGRVLRYRS